MNKDAILATAIGFVIGLTITACVLVGPKFVGQLPSPAKLFSKFPAITLPSIPGQTAKTAVKTDKTGTQTDKTTAPAHGVTIDSPVADSLETKDEILVSGTATAGSMVVILANTADTASVASDKGLYTGKVMLEEGRNLVTVTAITPSGETSSKTIQVFYTPEAL